MQHAGATARHECDTSSAENAVEETFLFLRINLLFHFLHLLLVDLLSTQVVSTLVQLLRLL